MSLPRLNSHAGAFILFSADEGLPIALLEAPSYELPVLASDIPTNQGIGLVSWCYFPSGDVCALATGLGGLACVPFDASACVERRHWGAECLKWDLIAEQTLQIYSGMSSR